MSHAEFEGVQNRPETLVLPINLVAGPAQPNPLMAIAVAIVLCSVIAPILFIRADGANPLLGIAVLLLGAAGIITVFGAVNGRRSVYRDSLIRIRARITSEGITLCRTPTPESDQFFPLHQIADVRLSKGSLVVQTTQAHPAPGRYGLRFGSSVIDYDQLTAAVSALMEKR